MELWWNTADGILSCDDLEYELGIVTLRTLYLVLIVTLLLVV